MSPVPSSTATATGSPSSAKGEAATRTTRDCRDGACRSTHWIVSERFARICGERRIWSSWRRSNAVWSATWNNETCGARSARQHAGQRKVVPTGQPRVDVGDITSHAAQCGDHRVDRLPRIFRGMLVAGEALSSLLRISRGPVPASPPPARRRNYACRAARSRQGTRSRRAPICRERAPGAHWRSRSRAAEADLAHGLPRESAREARTCAAGDARSDT